MTTNPLNAKTQVLYQIWTCNNKLLTSQRYDYLWGGGRQMLLDVLHIATSRLDLADFEAIGIVHQTKVWQMLKNFMPSPNLSLGFYYYMQQMHPNFGLNSLTYCVNSNGTQIQPDVERYVKVTDLTAKQHLLDKLMLSDENWYDKTKSDAGFVKVRFFYDEGDPMQTELYFYDSNYQEIGLHKFCQLEANKSLMPQDFEKGIKTLMKNCVITFKE